MRYTKILAIGLSTLIGVLGTSVVPTSAQDADPFGGSTETQTSVRQKSVQPKSNDGRSIGEVGHSSPSPTQMSDATRQRLKKLISLEYDEEAWQVVERDLEERLGINILLDQSAKDDSLDEDEPISIQLRDVPCNYALRLMLKEKNATYLVQAGVVQVISLDDAESDPVLFTRKVFNVDDLLVAIKRWNDLNRVEPETPADAAKPVTSAPDSKQTDQAASSPAPVVARAIASAAQFGGGGGGSGGGGGGGGGFGYGFGATGTWPSGTTPAGEQLIDLIYQAVNEDQWMDCGNGLATMSLVCGQLVVFGPETLISDVEELLAEFRDKLASD